MRFIKNYVELTKFEVEALLEFSTLKNKFSVKGEDRKAPTYFGTLFFDFFQGKVFASDGHRIARFQDLHSDIKMVKGFIFVECSDIKEALKSMHSQDILIIEVGILNQKKGKIYVSEKGTQVFKFEKEISFRSIEREESWDYLFDLPPKSIEKIHLDIKYLESLRKLADAYFGQTNSSGGVSLNFSGTLGGVRCLFKNKQISIDCVIMPLQPK